MREKLSLGGREYEPAGVGPVRHDLFIMEHARHAGIAGVEMADDETPQDFVDRQLAALLASGRVLLLLGAVLIPAGTKVEDWTKETARETAAALGAITDPAEKRKLYSKLAAILLDFSQPGLSSWVVSRRFSVGNDESGKEKSPGDTANGTDSSAQSQVTTST